MYKFHRLKVPSRTAQRTQKAQSLLFEILCKHGKGSVIMTMGPKSLSGPPTLESKSTQRYRILALLSSPVGDKHLLTAGFIQELVETDICQYGFNGSSGFSI